MTSLHASALRNHATARRHYTAAPCCSRAASSTAGPAAAPCRYARPGRRQPRARGLHRLRHRPLREPAERRRHGAGVGRQGAAVPARHRAAPRPLDAAGGLHGARRDDRRRARCARPTRRPARASSSRACSRCSTSCASARSTCSTAPACSTPTSRPGRESIEARAVREDEMPWDEIAFRTRGGRSSTTSKTAARGAVSACIAPTSASGATPSMRRQRRAPAAGRCRRLRTTSAAMPIDLAERRVRMDRLADVHRVGAHLDGQRDLADHVAGMRADDAAADDAVRLGSSNSSLVKPSSRPLAIARPDAVHGNRPFLTLMPLRLRLVLGQADPGDLGIGVGHARDHARVERAAQLRRRRSPARPRPRRAPRAPPCARASAGRRCRRSRRCAARWCASGCRPG